MRDEIAEDAVARVQAKMNSLFGDSPARSIEEIWGPGEEIDGYRIEREIGRGGFGQVYKAAEVNGGRTVAIKVFHHSSMTKEHFQREYDALKELSQVEGVVDLLRGNIDDAGNYYIVTEFVEGIPLDVMLEQERLPEGEASDYLEQLVAIIFRLHQWRDASDKRQFVHGDIKPTNIIVSDAYDTNDRRRITLIDFGVALLVPTDAITGEANATSYAQPVGLTPGYCAPEVQIEHRVTQAGDVFQAALVGYELVTGERYWHPTATDPHQALRRRSRELAFRLPRTSEEVKVLLRGQSIKRLVLRQALAWNPEDRFQTAAEFANALKHPWRWFLLRFRAAPAGWIAGLPVALFAVFVALVVVVTLLVSMSTQLDELQDTNKKLKADVQDHEANKVQRELRISELETELARDRDWRENATRRYRELVSAVDNYHREPTELELEHAERTINDWLRDYEHWIRADHDNLDAQKDLDHMLRLQKWLEAVGRQGRRVFVTVTTLSDNRKMWGGEVPLIVAVRRNDEYVAVSPIHVVARGNRSIQIDWSPDEFIWRLGDKVALSIWEGEEEGRSRASFRGLTREELQSLLPDDSLPLEFDDKTYTGKFRLRTEPVTSDEEINWSKPPHR